MTESLEPYYIFILLAAPALWFSYERGLSLMMFFQQEEYDGPRFLSWLRQKKGYDKTASVILFSAAVLGFFSHQIPALGDMLSLGLLLPLLITLAFAGGVMRSRAVRQDSKKPLVMTTRAKRILSIYMIGTLALFGIFSLLASAAPVGDNYAIGVEQNAKSWLDVLSFQELSYDWSLVALTALLLVFCQSLPVLLVVANKFLEPMEERVKAGFRNEAIDKFAKLQPKVIAITGSFGKTSTKHILSHILGAAAPTLATPGSVNTDMGITRVIREKLKPEHQFFIVEMGAYGPGSIARLCKLTPPDVGLITAVGAAHYERFKSLGTVAQAKFELAEAVFTKNGNVVVNTDGIDAALLEERVGAVPGNYTMVGENGEIQLTDLKQTADGLELSILDGADNHTLKVPLFGRHQSGNILLAASCARAVGLPWSAIKGALASVPQIKHRLEVGKNLSGPTIVNDAYNSNPVGFASALESMDALVKEGGRRILVTPGMVELGDKHTEEHERLGQLAAKHSDIVLVVTPNRIPSFLAGLHAKNDGNVTVMTFDKQEEAENWAKANWKENDVVLFENNLPDLYEASFHF